MTNPNSVAACLMKARYYPRGTFLQAHLGDNPSFCWRSILTGRDLLAQGCVRRIGNGRDTKIWNVPWLPDPVNPFIETEISQHHGEATVSALIDPTTKDWDIDLLHEFFIERDVKLITKIPVATDFEDQWTWKGDLRGLYAVKLGYQLMMRNTYNNTLLFTAWNQLWRLKIPPKYLNFIWRCAQSILPVKTTLAGRGMDLDTSCPFCNNYPETMNHVFIDCDNVGTVWSGDLHALQLGSTNIEFVAWLSMIIAFGNEDNKRLLIAHLWAIWKARNERLWNNKVLRVDDIKMLAASLVNSWTEQINLQGQQQNSTNLHVQLQQPFVTQLICKVDATVFADRGRAFYGVVILSSTGEFVAAKNGPLRCLDDPHTAEAMAIREALSWMKDNGWQQVQVETDCINVCHLLNAPSLDFSYAGCIIKECHSLVRHFENVSFRFIGRSANVLAHSLARAADSQSGPTVWNYSVPNCIQHLIPLD